MAITIKRATPADAAVLLDFLKQAGSETDNLTFGAEGVPFSVKSEEQFLHSIEHSTDEIMLVAKDTDKVVANASLSRLPRRMQHRGDFSVAVLKDYWNRGLGSQLLREVITFAKEHDFSIIDLQVRSDNFSAIHVYEKHGFKKIGTHPAFFKINDTDVSFDYMYLKL